MLQILQQSLDFMLELLAGGVGTSRSSGGESASFADMGVAIENLLEVSSPPVVVEGQDGIAGKSEKTDSIAISDLHSLVLSFSWLNMKECALLASEAMIGLSPSVTDVDDFKTSAEIMRKILIKVK